MTVEELATAIRDVRVASFPSLIGDRGGPTQATRGIETDVRPADLQYARVLLKQVRLNRPDDDE